MYLDVSAMSVHMRHTKWQNMVKHRNLLPWVDAFLLIHPYSHYKAKLHHRAEGMILWPSPYVMDEKDKVFTGKTTNLMIKLALYYLHCMLSSSWCCETSKKSVCQKSFWIITFVCAVRWLWVFKQLSKKKKKLTHKKKKCRKWNLLCNR